MKHSPLPFKNIPNYKTNVYLFENIIFFVTIHLNLKNYRHKKQNK